MAGVNKVILVGNLGSDPEVRHLSNGSVVANFNIATSESYTNRNGEKVTQTEWHRIEMWEGLAKIAEQYLKKGRTVFIEGKIRTENWQDQEGNNRTTTRIRAQNMQLLGGRQEGEPMNQMPEPAQQKPPVSKTNENSVNPDIQAKEEDIDDLPF